MAELTDDYALAPSAQHEFDYPKGSDNALWQRPGPTPG
jgi:uncharacterized membrane protein (UPF0182 family)